jgi:hypothetical protein
MKPNVLMSNRSKTLMTAALVGIVTTSIPALAQVSAQQAANRAAVQFQAPTNNAHQVIMVQNANANAPMNAAPVAPGPQTLNAAGLPIDPNAPLSPKDQALLEFRSQPPVDMPMFITQTQWTPAVEDQFSAFVAKFGAGVKAHPMRTLKTYMRDPSINMYASTDPAGVIFYSDCADLPYFLRSYFAFKNGLPMSIATDAVMNMHPFGSMPANGFDTWSMANPLRTDVSPYGNTLTHRAGSNIPSAPGREKNFLKYWEILMDAGSTRTFMVSPLTPNYDLSDVYPVKLDRSGIRPGTLIHTDGHMLVVINVNTHGDVELIDAHPDNSLQFKTLDPSKLRRDIPDRAYGFFRFRPAQTTGGQYLIAANGQRAIYGAKIVTESDQQLFAEGKWSMEQWFGPGSQIAPQQPVEPTAYKHAFAAVNFFDYLRNQLANTVETADDAAEDLFLGLCNDLKLRTADVQKAIDDGLPNQPHPATLPQDIFNADPAWEADATPSRDGRTRQAILNLPNLVVQKYKQGIKNQFKLTYAGTPEQFQQAVIAKLAKSDLVCKAVYKNSAGNPVTMNFSSLVARAPRMSFDMSDCVEKRWGARGAELATCRDQDPSNLWYAAEQSMRNTAGKLNDTSAMIIRSDRPITLQMLQSGQYVDQPDSSLISLGFSRSTQPDIKTYFASPQFVQDLSR